MQFIYRNSKHNVHNTFSLSNTAGKLASTNTDDSKSLDYQGNRDEELMKEINHENSKQCQPITKRYCPVLRFSTNRKTGIRWNLLEQLTTADPVASSSKATTPVLPTVGCRKTPDVNLSGVSGG